VVWVDEDWAYFSADGTVIEDQEEIDKLDAQDEPAGVEWKKRFIPVYGCADPAANSHLVYGRAPKISDAATANMPDDERVAAEQAAADARAAERRMVIANNRAWDVAEPVRRRWVKANIGIRKTLPKGAGAFMATTLANDPDMLHGCRRSAPTYGFLTEGESTWLKGASETRAQVVTLMLILTAYEAFTNRGNWRSKPAQTQRYLLWLQDQGYTLSDVERMAAQLPALNEPGTAR
jgi:ParB family chromosome partitioning protein